MMVIRQASNFPYVALVLLGNLEIIFLLAGQMFYCSFTIVSSRACHIPVGIVVVSSKNRNNED